MSIFISTECSNSSPIIHFDTKTQKTKPIAGAYPYELLKGKVSFSFISGTVLISLLNTKQNNLWFIFYDFATKKCKFVKSGYGKNGIGAYAPFFTKFYYVCSLRNKLISVNFDPVTLDVTEEEIVVDAFLSGTDNEMLSLTEQNGKLFSTVYNSETGTGFVYHNSLNRILYSDLGSPTNIFMNVDNRLCFCDLKDNMFYAGSFNKQIQGSLFCATEAKDGTGYWVLFKETPEKVCLQKLDYHCQNKEKFTLKNIRGNCYNIIHVG